MKRYVLAFMLCLIAGISTAQNNGQSLGLVNEYIRELSALEKVRDVADKELSQKDANTLMTLVRNSTRAQLELGTNISILRDMPGGKDQREMCNILINIFDKMDGAYKDMEAVATQMLAGPMPGVDYNRLVSTAPKITASIGFMEKLLFNTTPLVFSILVDMRQDKNGNMNHLLITKTERQNLIKRINGSFGEKLNSDGQSYYVNSAWALRAMLQKDYRSSDDPW